MPVLRQSIMVPDGFDSSRLRETPPQEMKLGITLRLPFRLRFHGLVHFECDANNGKAEIWFQNEVQIKPGTKFHELNRMHAYDEYWHYRTKAVVILHNAKITPELLNAIRSTDSRVQPEFSNGQLALEVLNRSIVAYAVETRQLFGLRVLSPLTTSQFHNQIIAGLLLVGYKGSQFAESDILELLSFGIDLPLDETHYEVWSGDIDDLPTIDQSRIQKLLSSHEENLHHELMFTAKNLMVQQQYATALVVAIAAVETVHGAFMRNALGRVLPNEEAERSRLINDFMREQGFYALVRMSPYLFLEQNERPLPEDVARCTRGIEIRNAIMHGLVRKGKFKMRQYSFEDYSDGYKGAIALYKAFSDALEKRREDG